MADSSKTEESLLYLGIHLMRHCRIHRLMPERKEKIRQSDLTASVSSVIDLFEDLIEALPVDSTRKKRADADHEETFSRNRFRGI
ncbi:MAG: hypothetical protein ACU0BN_14075 [Sulfitobacter sp.]